MGIGKIIAATFSGVEPYCREGGMGPLAILVTSKQTGSQISGIQNSISPESNLATTTADRGDRLLWVRDWYIVGSQSRPQSSSLLRMTKRSQESSEGLGSRMRRLGKTQ